MLCRSPALVQYSISVDLFSRWSHFVSNCYYTVIAIVCRCTVLCCWMMVTVLSPAQQTVNCGCGTSLSVMRSVKPYDWEDSELLCEDYFWLFYIALFFLSSSHSVLHAFGVCWGAQTFSVYKTCKIMLVRFLKLWITFLIVEEKVKLSSLLLY